MSMSTPIANIPNASGKEEQDPEVVELLNEMNTAVPPPIHREIPKKINQKLIYEEPKEYFHLETAQKAFYLAAIAFVVFYPNILNPLYEKFPVFEQIKDNELLVRSAILGTIVYAILWKFYL
jgi:hypothetical protein